VGRRYPLSRASRRGDRFSWRCAKARLYAAQSVTTVPINNCVTHYISLSIGRSPQSGSYTTAIDWFSRERLLADAVVCTLLG